MHPTLIDEPNIGVSVGSSNTLIIPIPEIFDTPPSPEQGMDLADDFFDTAKKETLSHD